MLSNLGVDRAVGFSLLNRAWSILSYPVTLYFVTTFFSRETQGYYFTFLNLLLLQAVMEMGVGTVMVQFVSHEWSRLRFGADGRIEGSEESLSRLASLVRMGLRWYAAAALLFLLATGLPGRYFLAVRGSASEIETPWWLLCVTVALAFPLVPLRSLLEGTDRIARAQTIGLAAGVASVVAGWGGIRYGAGLYVPAIVNGVLLIVNAALLIPSSLPYLRACRRTDGTGKPSVSWRNEFWPLQWRIALSWLCGFFMFQAFVPLIYYWYGPVEAGRMGATLSLFNAVNSFATAWIYATGPKMGILAARRDYRDLRHLVRRTLRQSLAAAAAAALGAMAVLLLMRHYRVPQFSRFSSLSSIALMLLAALALQVSNVETQAVRFQKKEPFVTVSVIGAVTTLGLVSLLGSRYGIPGAAGGFAAAIGLFLIPAVHMIYARNIAANDGEADAEAI